MQLTSEQQDLLKRRFEQTRTQIVKAVAEKTLQIFSVANSSRNQWPTSLISQVRWAKKLLPALYYLISHLMYFGDDLVGWSERLPTPTYQGT